MRSIYHSPSFCQHKQPGLFRSKNSCCQARYWHSARTSDLEVKNLQKEYYDARAGTGGRTNGSKHGKTWPVSPITIWMDSTVALYWLTSPGRNWKVFVANCVQKIAKITEELNISWKYCPTDKNIADLGSRGVSLDKMEKGNWFIGPEWLQHDDEWPEQPTLACSTEVSKEEKPLRVVVASVKEHKPDEWDQLLECKPYWSVLRITAWAIRFKGNTLANKQKGRKQKGALCTDEISKLKSPG